MLLGGFCTCSHAEQSLLSSLGLACLWQVLEWLQEGPWPDSVVPRGIGKGKKLSERRKNKSWRSPFVRSVSAGCEGGFS